MDEMTLPPCNEVNLAFSTVWILTQGMMRFIVVSLILAAGSWSLFLKAWFRRPVWTGILTISPTFRVTRFFYGNNLYKIWFGHSLPSSFTAKINMSVWRPSPSEEKRSRLKEFASSAFFCKVDESPAMSPFSIQNLNEIWFHWVCLFPFWTFSGTNF